MLIISWIGYTFFIENDALIKTPHKIRNIGSFVWIIIIGLIGYWGLQHSEKWIKKIWLYFYTLGIIILTIFGLLSWTFFNYTINVKSGLASCKLFLQSPMPFLLILLIEEYAKKSNLRSEK